MTKFNAEKYERFLEDSNAISSIGLIESFDERMHPEDKTTDDQVYRKR